MRPAILQCNAGAQFVRLIGGQRTKNPCRILALHRETRVHHGIRELARRGKDQQAAGADIQPADRQPARAAQSRQFGKHRLPPLRIFARDDFTFGLVINQNAVGLRY
jgi:hypothetical protein